MEMRRVVPTAPIVLPFPFLGRRDDAAVGIDHGEIESGGTDESLQHRDARHHLARLDPADGRRRDFRPVGELALAEAGQLAHSPYQAASRKRTDRGRVERIVAGDRIDPGPPPWPDLTDRPFASVPPVFERLCPWKAEQIRRLPGTHLLPQLPHRRLLRWTAFGPTVFRAAVSRAAVFPTAVLLATACLATACLAAVSRAAVSRAAAFHINGSRAVAAGPTASLLAAGLHFVELTTGLPMATETTLAERLATR